MRHGNQDKTAALDKDPGELPAEFAAGRESGPAADPADSDLPATGALSCRSPDRPRYPNGAASSWSVGGPWAGMTAATGRSLSVSRSAWSSDHGVDLGPRVRTA